MSSPATNWGASLHQSFRLVPQPSPHLKVFLESDGRLQEEVLAALPYDVARSRRSAGTPNSKRFRDPKHVYQWAGLLYQGSDGRIHLTEFGRTSARFLKVMNEENSLVLGQHAAYVLAGCQLRNPTRAGSKYSEEMEVFPCAFIWRAMLRLGNRITSEELNREIFHTKNEDDLEAAIEKIQAARSADDPDLLGDPVITKEPVNDRIIPWMSLASFGWTLILDKMKDPQRQNYRIRPEAVPLVERAASIRLFHRDFGSSHEYVEYLSELAGLPPNLSPSQAPKEDEK
jgi:hypothetical protein